MVVLHISYIFQKKAVTVAGARAGELIGMKIVLRFLQAYLIHLYFHCLAVILNTGHPKVASNAHGGNYMTSLDVQIMVWNIRAKIRIYILTKHVVFAVCLCHFNDRT